MAGVETRNRELTTQRWVLLKYAKYIGNPEVYSKSANDWKMFASTDEELMTLAVTENSHILITFDYQILENHSLFHGNDQMKGSVKGDSLLITKKLQFATRRFRVKFQTTEGCNECVTELRKFFTIKSADGPKQEETRENKEDGPISGEVSLAALTKAILKDRMPLAYKQSVDNQKSSEKLDHVIRLCLTDSDFPAFVGQVEKQLTDIMKE